MPATSTNPIKILSDLGYQLVDIESDEDYLSALMEAVNSLGASDYRIPLLQDEIKRIRVARKEKAPSPGMKITKKIISAEAFKKGSSVGGAEKSVPADTTGAKALSLRQPGGELSKDIEAPEQPTSPLDGLLGIVQSIAGGVDSIKQTLMDQQGLQKDASDDARKEKEQKKRGLKEKGLEAGGKAFAGIKKVGEKILEPAKSIFSKIIDFLVGILLGRTVIKLFDWFTDPANKKKVSAIFKFLKDWWPVLVAGILAFAGPLLSPVGFIAGVAALLAWGIPKIINIVKQLFGWVPGVNDALKDVDKDAKKTGENIVGDVQKESEKISKEIPAEEEGESAQRMQPIQDSAEQTQKGLQNVQPAQGMAEGGSVEKVAESKDGGQVRGEKGDDKVPAMLTDGEFVLSKDAVQKYGVDALLSLNAAAGATNKPSVKEGVPAFKEGGLVGGIDGLPGLGGGGGGTNAITDKSPYLSIGKKLINVGNMLALPFRDRTIDRDPRSNFASDQVKQIDGAPGVGGAPGQAGQRGQRGSGVLNIASKAANMFAPHLGIGDAIKSGPAGMLRQIAGKAFAPHMQMAQGMGQNVMSNPIVQQMMQNPAVQGLIGNVKESFAGSPLSKVAEGMFGKDTVNNVLGSIGAPGSSGAPGAPGAPGSAVDGISGAPGATPASIVGMAAADIKAGSPIMKSAKPPAGEGIKPLSSRSMSSTIAYDTELAKAGAGALESAGVGLGANTQEVPVIDAAKFISTNKITVLGITI